jgi:hypothetical protein
VPAFILEAFLFLFSFKVFDFAAKYTGNLHLSMR